MKFRIHHSKMVEGREVEDSIVLRGDSIEDIQKQAAEETKKRGWDEANCWSEEII